MTPDVANKNCGVLLKKLAGSRCAGWWLAVPLAGRRPAGWPGVLIKKSGGGCCQAAGVLLEKLGVLLKRTGGDLTQKPSFYL